MAPYSYPTGVNQNTRFCLTYHPQLTRPATTTTVLLLLLLLYYYYSVVASYRAQMLLVAECMHGGPAVEHLTERRRRRRCRRCCGRCLMPGQPTSAECYRHIFSLGQSSRPRTQN